MSKKPGPTAKGPSRIRFVMVDAEISDGDLSQVTQAIQNALRPTAQPPKRLLVPATPKANSEDVLDAEYVDSEIEAEEAPVEEATASNTPPAARSPRKPRTPKVIELEATAGKELEEYVKKYNPVSDRKRYLTIAAWFHLHRQTDVTADHIYTAYRLLKWPTNIKDFSQPLRDLKRDQLLEPKAKGTFCINHLGLAEVEKTGSP